MEPLKFDCIVLGAGIAGLSAADALQEKGIKIAVIDRGQLADGASGTPGALVNIATGRRGTKVWKAEACYQALKNTFHKVSAYHIEPFYRNNGILRPCLTEKMARKMKEQYQKTDWPEGWCQWLDRKSILQRHPGINCTGGGLWIPVGMTVDIRGYLKALARYIQVNDGIVRTECDYELRRNGKGWVVAGDRFEYQTDRILFATGYGTLNSPFWNRLPLSPVKGQVACYRTVSGVLDFTHSISSLGYIARIDERHFVQGSTYEHGFDDLQPDQEGLEYLQQRLDRTLPGLKDRSELQSQWAGVRVSTPNKKPVLGAHPEEPGLYIFTGLGSKGLLYSKYLAEHFADHLVEGEKLIETVSIQRMLQ